MSKKMNIGKVAFASLSFAGLALAGLWAVRNPEKAKQAFDSAKDTMRVAGTKVAGAAAAVPAALTARSRMNGAGEHHLNA